MASAETGPVGPVSGGRMHRLVVLCVMLALPAGAAAQTVAIAQISGVVVDGVSGLVPEVVHSGEEL